MAKMSLSQAIKKFEAGIKDLPAYVLDMAAEDIRKYAFEDTGELKKSVTVVYEEGLVGFELSPTNTDEKLFANEYGTHKMRGSSMVAKARARIPKHVQDFMDKKI